MATVEELEILSRPTVPPGTEPPLYTDYCLGRPEAVSLFACAPSDPHAIGARAEQIARAGYTERDRLADRLTDTNRRIGNSDAALASIEVLRSPNGFAVVTGQQAGFLTGPLYTLYKAFTAVRLAEQLTHQLKPLRFVPLFWIASDDHDLDEIAPLRLPYRTNGQTAPRQVRLPLTSDGRSAREATIAADDWAAALDAVRPLLPDGGALLDRFDLGEQSDTTPPKQFAAMMTRLLGPAGLILIEPADLAPLYAGRIGQILRSGDAIRTGLEEGARAVRAAGYEPALEPDPQFSGVYWSQNHRRSKLLSPEAKETDRFLHQERTVRLEALEQELADRPETFSGNVWLRPLLQDQVLPTAAYVAGPSEIAYLAQLRPLYDRLELTMPAIVPRFSATLVDPRTVRLLAKFNLAPDQLDSLALPTDRPGAGNEPVDLAAAVQAAGQPLRERLQAIGQAVAAIDPTQQRPFNKAIARIEAELARLAARAETVHQEAAGIGQRQWSSIRALLCPDGAPQERYYNGLYFLAQYGPDFFDTLCRQIDPFRFGHRLILTG